MCKTCGEAGHGANKCPSSPCIACGLLSHKFRISHLCPEHVCTLRHRNPPRASGPPVVPTDRRQLKTCEKNNAGGFGRRRSGQKITLLLMESQASSRFLLGSHDKIIMHAHGTSVFEDGSVCHVTFPRKFFPCRRACLQLAPIGANFQHGKSNSSYVNTGEIPLKLGAQIRPVSISRLHDRVRVLIEMRRDDLGSWIQINGCSSRAAAAAPIAP